jgi:hypothetical protein
LDVDLPRPRSSAERWANLVFRLLDSPADLKTIGEWARFAAVSYTSLCECSRIVGLRPHDGRDFARVLRALLWTGQHGQTGLIGQPESLLNVADRRTLAILLKRSGGALAGVSVFDFVARQTFIPSDNDGLRVVVETLEKSLRSDSLFGS